MRICAVYKHTPRPESRPRALPSGPGTTGGTREQDRLYPASSYLPFPSRLRADAFGQPVPNYSELAHAFAGPWCRFTHKARKGREGSALRTGYLRRPHTLVCAGARPPKTLRALRTGAPVTTDPEGKQEDLSIKSRRDPAVATSEDRSFEPANHNEHFSASGSCARI